jgi:hypothetical protein
MALVRIGKAAIDPDTIHHIKDLGDNGFDVAGNRINKPTVIVHFRDAKALELTHDDALAMRVFVQKLQDGTQPKTPLLPGMP